MMDLSVMSIVESIFDWVLQCINGGVLNVFFTPKLNQTTNKYSYEFAMNTDKLLDYVKGMVLLKGADLPLDVLKTFPEELGGGTEGVKTARENPNREIYFIAGPLVAAILMLIAILGMLFISFCACCTRKRTKKRPERMKEIKERKHRSGGKKDRNGNGHNPNQDQDAVGYVDQPQDYTVDISGGYYYKEFESDPEDDGYFESNIPDYDADGVPRGFKENLRGLFLFYKTSVFGSKVEEKQAVVLEEIEELMDKASFTRKHQACICCGCHLVTLILSVIYVLALIICIVIYIMAAQQLAAVMGQFPEDETTIRNDVIAWISGKSNNFNFPATVSFILKEVVNLLDDSVTNLLDTMNSTIGGLTTTLEPKIDGGVNNTFSSLIQSIKVMELFKNTKELAEKLTEFKKYVEKVDNNYQATVPELGDLNREFDDIRTALQSQSPPLADLALIKIDFVQSNVNQIHGATAINNFVDTFLEFAGKLDDLEKKLSSMPTQITDNIKQQLDLSPFYTQIETQVNALLQGIKPQIEGIAKTFPEYIKVAQPYIAPALYAPVGVMLVIAIAFFVCLMIFIMEACRFRIFSCSGEGPSELASIEKIRRKSRACGGCRLCICSLLLILMVVLAILAAVIMVITSFLAAELCPYLWQIRGINQSDYVMNSFVDQRWPPIENELLDMPAPNNILFAIGNSCNPVQTTDPKLLPSIGVTRLMNLNKLSEDPELIDQFTEMSKDMADKITQSIDPNILSNLDKLKNDISTLNLLLQALKPGDAVVELEKFTSKNINELWNLQKQVQDATQANKLTGAIQKLEGLIKQTEIIQSGYQGLADKANLPTELESFIDIAKGILNDLMNKTNMEGIMDKEVTPEMLELMKELFNIGDGSVNSITQKVLPCSSIHYIATSLVATGCSNSGLNNRFFGWALALILTVLFSFLSFVGLFNLWCCQSRQIRRFYGT